MYIYLSMKWIKPIGALFLACVMVTSINAQTISLDMTVDEFTAEFGKPDNIVPYDVPNKKCEFYFYGDDSFSFMDGVLSDINISSRRIGLQVSGPDEIRVGAPASLITDNLKEWFKEDDSFGKFHRYICLIRGGQQIIHIQTYGDEITCFSVSKAEKNNFSEEEFRDFFRSSFKPIDNIPENSIWPSGLNADWKQAAVRKSKDAGSATCSVPFIGKLKASAVYEGKQCPEIAGRLVITKILDGRNIFKPGIVSLVPKPGLLPGDEFSGLVVYDNANSGTTFAWEYYEKGRLLYSHFPASKTPVKESEITLEMRRTHKLIYIGGADGISDEDWAMIVTNRINVTKAFTQSFPEGWDEKKVLAEKQKFKFSTTANPDYVEPAEEEVQPESENTSTDVEEKTVSTEDRSTDGEELTKEEEQFIIDYFGESLPTYVGKANNLSSIIRPKDDPIEVSMLRNTEGSATGSITCENSGDCECTIVTELGQIYRAYPGNTTIKDAILRGGYYWYLGNAISNVNVKFPYAMPLAPGTKVRFMKDPRERYRSFVVLAKIGTPAFAMRAGRVCSTDDENCILVVHEDGTFAAYMNVEDRCVFPGDYIYPGDHIGNCGGGRLSISIFYLDRNKIKDRTGYPYTHLSPYFETADGPVKLETGAEYISFLDKELITKEMSASQKKRYQQNTP